jgi:hypothetical protein
MASKLTAYNDKISMVTSMGSGIRGIPVQYADEIMKFIHLYDVS